VLIANKADRCDTRQQQAFLDFAAELPPRRHAWRSRTGTYAPRLPCLDSSPPSLRNR